ncbi:hypothetical protein Dimus_013396, partial [Dionaea muscipula]
VGEEKEAPTEGTVGGTQESEAVVSKNKPKPKAKPKKKDVVSPAIGENIVGEEEGDDEGDKCLKLESEEAESDENVQKLAADSGLNKEERTRKRRQKQAARTGPAAKKAKTDKEKVPLVETEPTKEPVVADSPTIAELEKEVDESLSVHLFLEDVDEGNLKIKRKRRVKKRQSLFSSKRLGVPPSRMIRECMDIMMEIWLRRQSIGDVLRAAVQTDDRRCRKIDRLMEEKFALENDIKELKFERDSAIEISSQVKADVEMVMEENQSLEKENEELKFALEGEKKIVQTLEDKIKELQTALGKEKKEKEEKEKELVASYKKHQELLHKKMDLDTSLYERNQENEKLQTSLTQVCNTSLSIICKLFLNV